MKHNLYKSRIYNVWRDMNQRCENNNLKCYKNYGGRGIKVSAEWKHFINFYNDMMSSYKEGLELDRIDNDGDYCKENCRWTTHNINNRNRRKSENKTSKYKGVCYYKYNNKWRATISVNNKSIHLGFFSNEEDASKAYNDYICKNGLI